MGIDMINLVINIKLLFNWRLQIFLFIKYHKLKIQFYIIGNEIN